MWIVLEVIGDVLQLVPYPISYLISFTFLLLNLAVAWAYFRGYHYVYYRSFFSPILSWIDDCILLGVRLGRALLYSFNSAPLRFIAFLAVEWFRWLAVLALCCLWLYITGVEANPWLLRPLRLWLYLYNIAGLPRIHFIAFGVLFLLRYVRLVVGVLFYYMDSHDQDVTVDQIYPPSNSEVTILIHVRRPVESNFRSMISSALATDCASVLLVTEEARIFERLEVVQANQPRVSVCLAPKSSGLQNLSEAFRSVETPFILLAAFPCIFPPLILDELLEPFLNHRIGAVASGQRVTRPDHGSEPRSPLLFLKQAAKKALSQSKAKEPAAPAPPAPPALKAARSESRERVVSFATNRFRIVAAPLPPRHTKPTMEPLPTMNRRVPTAKPPPPVTPRKIPRPAIEPKSFLLTCWRYVPLSLIRPLYLLPTHLAYLYAGFTARTTASLDAYIPLLPSRATIYRATILQDPHFLSALARPDGPAIPSSSRLTTRTWPSAAARTDEDALGWFLSRWLLKAGWKVALRGQTEGTQVEVPVPGPWLLTKKARVARGAKAQTEQARVKEERDLREREERELRYREESIAASSVGVLDRARVEWIHLWELLAMERHVWRRAPCTAYVVYGAGLLDWSIIIDPAMVWLAWDVWGKDCWRCACAAMIWMLGWRAAEVLACGFEFEKMDWEPSVVRFVLLALRRMLWALVTL